MNRSPLVPEQRTDRNGVLVTRHVRQQPVMPSPAPALPPTPPLDQRAAVARALQQHPHLPQWREAIERSIAYLPADKVARLAEILPDLDERGAISLFGGFAVSPNDAREAARYFAAAIGAYEMARDADDAVLPGSYRPQLVDRDTLLAFVIGFFKAHSRPLATTRLTEGDISDVRAAYLLSRCGLSLNEFETTGDYFRSLQRVNDEYERIRPRLPLLIAAHTAYNGSDDWYFGDGTYYFWAFLESISEYPEESIVPIAVETLRREGFDEAVAREIADGIAPSLADGTL